MSKWVTSGASRLRERQNRSFASRAQANISGAASMFATVGGGGGRKRPARRREALVVASSEQEEEVERQSLVDGVPLDWDDRAGDQRTVLRGDEIQVGGGPPAVSGSAAATMNGQQYHRNNIPPPPMRVMRQPRRSSMPYAPTSSLYAGRHQYGHFDQQQQQQQQQQRPPFAGLGQEQPAKRRRSITTSGGNDDDPYSIDVGRSSTFDDLDTDRCDAFAAEPTVGEIGFAARMAGVFLEDMSGTVSSTAQHQQQRPFSRMERVMSLPPPQSQSQRFAREEAAQQFSGGNVQQTPSSSDFEYDPDRRTSQNVLEPVPPPFGFIYGRARPDGAAAGAHHGFQRFKKPSPSTHMSTGMKTEEEEVHIELDSLFELPQWLTDENAECIEIHRMPSGSTSVHPISTQVTQMKPPPPTHVPSISHYTKEKEEANEQDLVVPVQAPPIRFFNNGVEVTESGTPIVTPNQRLREGENAQKNRQVEKSCVQSTANTNKVATVANNSSPVPSVSGEDSSLSPPLPRSCTNADVVSFAVKRVPELSKRFASSNQNTSASTNDILQGLYRIVDEIKSKTSPKAGTDAKQVKDFQLLHTRVSNTIRSIEGYKRGLAAASTAADNGRNAAKKKNKDDSTIQGAVQDLQTRQADIWSSFSAPKEQPATNIAPSTMKSSTPSTDPEATAPAAATAAPAGPHSTLIYQIFGGQDFPSSSSKHLGSNPQENVKESVEDLVKDSLREREKHVSAASALIDFSTCMKSSD